MYVWCETNQELGIKGQRQRAPPCTPQGREGWRQIWWGGGVSFASATGLGRSLVVRAGMPWNRLSFEGCKMVAGRQVPIPCHLTFKILYAQPPICNSLTLWLQYSQLLAGISPPSNSYSLLIVLVLRSSPLGSSVCLSRQSQGYPRGSSLGSVS